MHSVCASVHACIVTFTYMYISTVCSECSESVLSTYVRTSPQSKGVVCVADAMSYVLKNVYKRVPCTYV